MPKNDIIWTVSIADSESDGLLLHLNICFGFGLDSNCDCLFGNGNNSYYSIMVFNLESAAVIVFFYFYIEGLWLVLIFPID